MTAQFDYVIRFVSECWECALCGALVVDRAKHDPWHSISDANGATA